MPEMSCAQCGTALLLNQTTCRTCGTLTAGVKTLREANLHRRKIRSGRGAILAVAVLTLLGGILMYFLGQSETEKEIAKVESQISSFNSEQRELFESKVREESGMSWDQVVASDRGRVKMLLATNVALSVLYLALWFWAKKNPLGAALVAFIVYVTVIVASALYDPKTIGQGLFVKIAIITSLISAVSSGYKFRRFEPSATA